MTILGMKHTRGIETGLYYMLGELHRRPRDQRGATTAEYGLIAALCLLAFIGGIEALKLALGGLFGATQDSMDSSVPAGPP